MPNLQNPLAATQVAQYNRIQSGGEQDSYLQADYLWGSGLNDAHVEKILLWKYGMRGKYFLHDWMTHFNNRSYPVAQQDHAWYEMGKTRVGATVGAVSAVGSATITADTQRTVIYHHVNDILNLSSGISAKVTNVTLAGAGGTEQLTLTKKDGTNWAAGELVTGMILGHSHNEWGEQTAQPAGRTWRPEQKDNKLTRIKRTFKMSGDAITTKSILQLPGSAAVWVYAEQEITMQEFLRDRDNMLAWSAESLSTDTVESSRGVIKDIEANSNSQTTYTGAVVEANLIAQIKLLEQENDSGDYIVLPGSTFYSDITTDLKDYAVQGAVNYGNFSTKKQLAVGFGVSQYKFGDVVLSFKRYRGLDSVDDAGYPASGTPSASHTNYRNFALFINEGTGGARANGQEIPMLSYMYKAIGGVDRSLVFGHYKGMTGTTQVFSGQGVGAVNAELFAPAYNNQVSHDEDSDSFFLLAQVGPRLTRVDNMHGMMRAIG